ncbi:unnamed protein product (macronuclear) [Paramecium tetraurelia]|uniref:ODAD1 central coiled coil region domain-containing protein n=1 Tax=Paramecium tetraurelia TaxID=5888 RepID=A0CVX5_PARTE|nr:uncharacterized protein GSPATT00001144001 [Paramecium tetraurelia]CAK74942.1 unnamed protein product [Paramecium tetraurelia]|eukprot:XP_001442339.1 hypothetical protein (macronuclear) [Paramecium tetraurelia strain d4-2]
MPRSSKVSNRSFSHGKQGQLNEPIIITLQREIDNYTRKVEIERRKLFNLEQQHRQLQEEVKSKVQSVKKLKMDSIKKVLNKDQAESKSLQFQIDQFDKKLCKSVANIEIMKSNIDIIRKERNQLLQAMKEIEQNHEQIHSRLISTQSQAQRKVHDAQITQQQMFDLKTKNEIDKSEFQEKFDKLKAELKEKQEKQNEKDKISKTNRLKATNYSTFDTGTLLKRRLQRIIANNKEKVKMIDTYQRNMRIIDEAFNQIKEATGLTDIEEIKNNFIKSEEQNYSLWTYVDVLNQEIDALEDSNQELKEKCEIQEKENIERDRILTATPDGERKRKYIQRIIDQKQDEIDQFGNKLSQIQPIIEDILQKMIKTRFNHDPTRAYTFQGGFQLNESNIDQYLAELEGYINMLVLFKSNKYKRDGLNQNKFITGLLLEEIPTKEFKPKQQLNQSSVLPSQGNEEGSDFQKFLNYNEFHEMAKQALKEGDGQNFTSTKKNKK